MTNKFFSYDYDCSDKREIKNINIIFNTKN